MRALNLAAVLLAFASLLSLASAQHRPTTPTTIQKLTPNMMVDDVNATVEFYRSVLGFDLVVAVPDSGRLDWALVQRDDVEMMFQARQSLIEEMPLFQDRPAGGALTFYLDVEGVEGLYERLRARVRVVKDLHETFYGTREFAIEDCNGFILTFAEGGQN